MPSGRKVQRMTVGELIEILEKHPKETEMGASHGSCILYVQDETGRPRAVATFMAEMPKYIYQGPC